MDKDKQERRTGLQEIGMSLDDLVRRGARQVIQQAIEVELTQLLEQYENVKTLHGQRSVTGVPFKDGIQVNDNPPEQQKFAA